MDDHLKRDILLKIRQVASNNGGKPPGVAIFETATGVKRHEWQGKIWRNWSDAIAIACEILALAPAAKRNYAAVGFTIQHEPHSVMAPTTF